MMKVMVSKSLAAPKSLSRMGGEKKFPSGESNPGLLRDRQKCYQLHQTGKGTTGVEPVTAGSAIPCSTTELRTHLSGVLLHPHIHGGEDPC